MTKAKTGWLLLGILCLASFAVAQDTAWEKYNKAGMKAYRQGQYAEAEKQWVSALKEAETFGPQDPRLATSLNNLAALYKAQGKYAEAEPLHLRALAIREKVLGPEHPQVATSLNNLAELYRTQGKYAQAEPLYKRSLAIKEKVLGPEHPSVATSLNNLAALYKAQGHYAEAEPLYRRALAIKEKALGPEHPGVATTLNNLAELYRAQGQYAEAEPLHKRALAIREKGLGPEHPRVATSLNNLAMLYRAQGKYTEAEPLYRRSLAIDEKALGPEHPNVATVLENYAVLLRKTKRKREAKKLEARAKAIRAKHGQGAESPETGSVKTTAVSSALSEIDPAKETDIRHLMEVTGAKKQLNQMLPFMAKQMKPLIEQLIMSRLPPDLRDPQIPERFVQRVIERFDPDELINRIVPVYDKYYTREEIKEMVRFFETPLGKKFLETSPQLMQESMTVGQQYGA